MGGTWGGKRFRAKAMRAQSVHISLLPLATLVAPILGQLQFNGGVSSSSSNSNGNSANRNTNRPSSGDVDEKFFLGGDTPSLTGNQALDGGIVGLGLGALGAAVLGPTIQGALNGGQQSQGFNSCGRRKRQANFGGSTSPGGAGAGGQDLDGGAVLLAHRPGLHLQQWQKAEASTWRGPAWNKVLWRSLWWHPSLWQLLLQQPAFQQQRFQQQLPEPGRIQQSGLYPESGFQPEPGLQQPEQPSLPMRLQPNVPGPEREHPRRVPAQRQHGEDVVLHHRLEQQLWRPADLEEISKQPLVLHGLQQPRTIRNVKSAIIQSFCLTKYTIFVDVFVKTRTSLIL